QNATETPGTSMHHDAQHDQQGNLGQSHTLNTSSQDSSSGSTGFRGSHAEGQGAEHHQPAVTY
ncbi:MAG TPA: hypothetical protein VES20_04960, partial [Bryobacteraceae bacterium]|nr:hypothetical protein [Bryobacteraceae bacterium]